MKESTDWFVKIRKKLKKNILIIISKILIIIYFFLPNKLSFFFIVCMHVISQRLAIFMARTFISINIAKLAKKSENLFSIFSNKLTKQLPFHSASILYLFGMHNYAIKIIINSDLMLHSKKSIYLICLAYFELADFKSVNHTLNFYIDLDNNNGLFIRFKALMELLNNNEILAKSYLEVAANNLNNGWCPHQNISARYPDKYNPVETDRIAGRDGLLFDAYNFLGQRLTHIGIGDIGLRFYDKAFKIQNDLRNNSFKLSHTLENWLIKNKINPNCFYILGWEWSTQIGHLGMLDILFRMKALGWWKGDVIILSPPEEKIANKIILSLFKNQALLLSEHYNNDTEIAKELFSLQRYLGITFNAWEFPDGNIVPWQQAGAIAIRQWENEQRENTLKKTFDLLYLEEYFLNNYLIKLKHKWAMKPTDWFVCLHIRDGNFYGEISGLGQTHRNADIQTYIDAIKFVTNKGGWIIKLGAKNSPKLPPLKRVIDYARSNFTSELLDIYFIRNARFFIGTTSGLTNMAISFDVPSALVNCITIDSQLWNKKVRFALKHIMIDNQKLLNQRQLTCAPWRWRMFSADVLKRYGATVVNNTSDEILEVVKEIFFMTDSQSNSYMKQFPNAKELINQWRKTLCFEEFYGSALPSLYYLQKNKSSFLQIQENEALANK